MRNKIMMGRYMDTGSWIHQLDPRAKVTAMLLFMLVIFMISSLTGAFIVMIFSILIISCTRVPFIYYSRAIKPLLFLIGFITLFQILFTSGGSRLLTVGAIHIYTGGVCLLYTSPSPRDRTR